MIRFIIALLFLLPNFRAVAAAASARPNIVLILADNLGYGDLGCYGSTLHRTPIIDGLASDGMKFTSCYAASGVCTPSRAALLTGCYAQRVNLHVSERGRAVLQPVSPKGLHPNEITIAEILKNAGYATACIGKWHVGDQPEFLPTRQGFDEFFGLPYSEDMTPRPNELWPPLPLLRGERVVESPANCETLAERYAVEAAQFIQRNRNKPFFLYVAPAEPGSVNPPIAGARFKGKSSNSAWGDAVEELNWLTGEILAALKAEGLDQKTLVIFTSDNGAPKRQPPQGSNAPLGGWGYTTAEGGMRVPFLARWPEKIPAGKSCDELVTLMDLLPTFARLAGTTPPSDRILDGKNFWQLLSGKRWAKSPRESFYYYHMDQLQAVRDSRWKLSIVAPATLRPSAGQTSAEQTPVLFDLKKDPSESRNVAAEDPEVVRRLKTWAERARLDLGDVGAPGRNQRPAGMVSVATPRVLERSESATAANRALSFGGERHDFIISSGHTAFVILPKDGQKTGGEKRPWIWYAPTFVPGAHPGRELEWLFPRLMQAGFALAGIDVGESYGNPAGRKLFSQFHARVVKEFGLSPKACLLPQSRGGLMLYNWAVEHPKNIQCVGGIYTVGNLASYPGLDKAAPAYGMTREELASNLPEHNPIDRLAPLAKAKVPVFHIHGDADKLVPLEKNAGELVKRYRALGGPAQLIVVPGKGHEISPDFFQSQALLDFFLSHREKDTKLK